MITHVTKSDKRSMTKQQEEAKLVRLMDHYAKGTQEMETRKSRKQGWNDTINSYMGKLPDNWPYISRFTDPVIRTTILEKTSRLLNSKLKGRLVPREGGDMIKAKINNALLDFQWDYACEGGSMLEKVAKCDQITRLFGASFTLNYWNSEKNCNEIKVIDPRDIFIDFSADHIRNAKWVQIREFTTAEALEARGYDVKKLRQIIKNGGSDSRQNAYVSQVKSNRGVEDMSGKDLDNPTIEVVTEYTPTKTYIFAPRHGVVIDEFENKYKHGKIPVSMLRYYPLPDELYGESEVEPVIPLSKVINATLCGFFDEMNLAMRPPVKIVSGQARIETIEYGPGARWILNDPNAVQEAAIGGGAVQAFTTVYPALKAAFNTAMGDQSQAVSNMAPFKNTSKTATEIVSLEKQQNNRDQYNQLYLAEFLKDIMLMWLSNNKQYLFDDPTKSHYIVKIVGRDMIEDLQKMGLGDMDIPDDVVTEMSTGILDNPGSLSDGQIKAFTDEVRVPVHPVITNPDDPNPENYKIVPKFGVENGLGQLYMTKDDLDGVYDYIPDVKSMALGAGLMQQQARNRAYEMILGNPNVLQALQTQGEMLKIKELLVNILEDAGERDAEALFEENANIPTGPAGIGPSQLGSQVQGGQAVEGSDFTLPPQPGPTGISPTQGF